MDSFLVSAIGNAIYTLFRSKERPLLGDSAMPERTVGMHRNSPPFFSSAQFSASARRNTAARRSSGASAQRVAAISAPALRSARADRSQRRFHSLRTFHPHRSVRPPAGEIRRRCKHRLPARSEHPPYKTRREQPTCAKRSAQTFAQQNLERIPLIENCKIQVFWLRLPLFYF